MINVEIAQKLEKIIENCVSLKCLDLDWDQNAHCTKVKLLPSYKTHSCLKNLRMRL